LPLDVLQGPGRRGLNLRPLRRLPWVRVGPWRVMTTHPARFIGSCECAFNGPSTCRGLCVASGEERHCLPIQPRVSHHSAKASTAREVEAYDLVLRGTVERAVGTKPQTAGSAELGRAAG
jgi:hypothetical protein